MVYVNSSTSPPRQNRAKLIQLAVVLALGCIFGWTLTAIAPLRAKQVSAAGPLTSPSTLLQTPSRGIISDVLYRQGLSHVAFHSVLFKLHLAKLILSTKRVAVVGVEWGDEVRAFGAAGYEVHAFEPLSKFHDNAKQVAEASGWNVHMYKVAAGSTSGGELRLKYQRNVVEVVKRARLDDYLNVELDVLSIDIQGNEYDVLQGAENLINSGKVRSLWIEVFPCNPKVEQIVNTLDRNYVIFDFVPWGKLSDGSNLQSSWTARSDAVEMGWNTRPSAIKPYLSWLCKSWKRGFEWSQSDIVAVRRDLVSPQLLHKLTNIGNDVLLQSLTANKKKKK